MSPIKQRIPLLWCLIFCLAMKEESGELPPDNSHGKKERQIVEFKLTTEGLEVDHEARNQIESVWKIKLNDLSKEIKAIYKELHEKELRDRIVVIASRKDFEKTLIKGLNSFGHILPILIIDQNGVAIGVKIDQGDKRLILFWSADGKSISTDDPNSEYELTEVGALGDNFYLLGYIKKD